MGESSKSGALNGAQALRHHLDQDRSAHAGPSSRAAHAPDSFRNGHNDALIRQFADEHYAQEQFARMNLDDVNRTNNPGFVPGPHGAPIPQPFMYGPGRQPFVPGSHQRGPNAVPVGNHRLLSVEEFQNSQAETAFNNGRGQAYPVNPAAQHYVPEDVAVGGASTNMHRAMPQMPGPQYMGPPFGAQAYSGHIGPQPGYMPGFIGHNYAPGASLAQGQRLAQSETQSTGTLRDEQHEQKEIAAAWEASFEEAMDEWMATQFSLDPELMAGAREATQATPTEKAPEPDLSSSDLARAAQQLVDAVADNDSEKFRKSNFVDLMRRIAAQEVVVENNALVEANPEIGMEGGMMSDVTGSATAMDKGKGKGKAVAMHASVEDDELSL
ncbi:hypothetical protein SCUP234_08729 [Seiridium cupressi]